MGIREIVVFTNGDSRKTGTWSNIPYYFTKTLESKGLRVYRFNLQPSFVFKAAFKFFFDFLFKRFYPDSTYSAMRSGFHHWLVRLKVTFAAAIHPNTQSFLFLTASYNPKYLTNKKIILFCDWTYEHELGHFKQKLPNRWEKAPLIRENESIEKAFAVFSLFPAIAKKMAKRYKNPNIFYIGNVINSEAQVDVNVLCERKALSSDIIFIGRKNYLAGAETLIEAFKRLKKSESNLKLHIIGLTEKQVSIRADDVFYYGYLDKEIPEQSKLFYSLLSNAAVFINTTPKWGSFSAMVEGLYFCTPLIVSPFDEFVETFGRSLSFGFYCEQNTPEQIELLLAGILRHPERKKLCLNAHGAVKDFTWSNYVDGFLGKLNEIS